MAAVFLCWLTTARTKDDSTSNKVPVVILVCQLHCFNLQIKFLNHFLHLLPEFAIYLLFEVYIIFMLNSYLDNKSGSY